MANLFYCGNQWGYLPSGQVAAIPVLYCNPPLQPSVIVTNHNVSFTWATPHDALYYLIRYRVKGTEDWTEAPTVKGRNLTIPLEPTTTYEWQIRTHCAEDRFSTWQNGNDFTTGIFAPACVAASGLFVSNMGSFYRLSWISSNATYYKVELATPMGGVLEYTTQKTYYDFDFLMDEQLYKARVISVCATGGQPDSGWLEFKSGCLNVPAPTGLNFIKGTNSVLLSWYPPAGGTYSYNLYLNDQLLLANYMGVSFDFLNLTPDTQYSFSVRTNAVCGFSDAATLQVKTDPAVCTDPINIVVENKTPTGFTIRWQASPGNTVHDITIGTSAPVVLPSGIYIYTVTDQIPGSVVNTVVRTVCDDRRSNGVTTSVQLDGCPAITNVQMVAGADKITYTWDPIANAISYTIRIIGGDVDRTETVFSNTFTFEGLTPQSPYAFKGFANCVGNTKGPETSSIVGSTVPKLICQPAASYTVSGQTLTSVIIHPVFASGHTGYTRIILDGGASGKQEVDVNSFDASGILFSDLVPGAAYNVIIYEPGFDCVPPIPLSPVYQHVSPCIAPVIQSVVWNEAATALVTDVVSPAGSGPFEVRYVISDVVIDAPVAVFPYAHELPYGQYQVFVRRICNGIPSDWSPAFVNCVAAGKPEAAVNQNEATVSWPPVPGVSEYVVVLNSSAGGEQTYSTSGTFIKIPDLTPLVSYSAKVGIACNGSVSFSPEGFFTTGTTTPVPPTANCPAPVISAYSQACAVTNPNDPSSGGSNPPTSGLCTIVDLDWQLVHSSFVASNSTEGSLFMEAAFSISVTAQAGDQIALPGGVMGILRNCFPTDTVVCSLIIASGGQLMTGSGTITTNGNITAIGTYISNGAGTLVVVVRGSYNKI